MPSMKCASSRDIDVAVVEEQLLESIVGVAAHRNHRTGA
jgi:hypothetical protein